MYIKNIFKLQDNDYSNATQKDKMYNMIDGKTNNLYIYDNNKTKIDTKTMLNNYKLITYNSINNFYVMNTNNSVNFKIVNMNFEEINDFIIIPNFKRSINDIAFDKDNNRYLLVDNLLAYAIDSNGKFIKSLINTNDFYEKTYDCCYKLIVHPNDFKFTAIGTDGKYIYVAYIKNGSTYLAKLSQKGNLVENMFIGDNIIIKSILFNDGLYLLGNESTNNNLYEIGTSSGGNIDPKIQEIIDKIIVLLNNVAINEEKVANLIDAESQKIKKIVETSDNFEEILAINNSAKEIITLASAIENSQYDNLVIILESIIELEKYLN